MGDVSADLGGAGDPDAAVGDFAFETDHVGAAFRAGSGMMKGFLRTGPQGL